MKRVLSLLLSVVMLLGVMTSCQGNNAGDSSNTYRYLYSGEVTTLNYLVTGSSNEISEAANFID